MPLLTCRRRADQRAIAAGHEVRSDNPKLLTPGLPRRLAGDRASPVRNPCRARPDHDDDFAAPGPTGGRLVLIGTEGGQTAAVPGNTITQFLLVDDEPAAIDCGYSTARQVITVSGRPEQVGRFIITHQQPGHDAGEGTPIHVAWIGGARPSSWRTRDFFRRGDRRPRPVAGLIPARAAR